MGKNSVQSLAAIVTPRFLKRSRGNDPPNLESDEDSPGTYTQNLAGKDSTRVNAATTRRLQHRGNRCESWTAGRMHAHVREVAHVHRVVLLLPPMFHGASGIEEHELIPY